MVLLFLLAWVLEIASTIACKIVLECSLMRYHVPQFWSHCKIVWRHSLQILFFRWIIHLRVCHKIMLCFLFFMYLRPLVINICELVSNMYCNCQFSEIAMVHKFGCPNWESTMLNPKFLVNSGGEGMLQGGSISNRMESQQWDNIGILWCWSQAYGLGSQQVCSCGSCKPSFLCHVIICEPLSRSAALFLDPSNNYYGTCLRM
jgi:hypothetical protein